MAVGEQIDPRTRDADFRSKCLNGRPKSGPLGKRHLSGTDHPRCHAVEVPVERRRGEEDTEHGERRGSIPADPPEEAADRRAETEEEGPGLEYVPRRRPETHGFD
jgi:hypothetical protein